METPPNPQTPPNQTASNININNSNKTQKIDPYAFRKTIQVEPPKYTPALSPLKFKIITTLVCTTSFYLCCISEFGDHNDNNNNTVTSGFRKWHDKVLSDLLGFNVREKIRSIEKSFFKIKDSTGNIVGDLSSAIKIKSPNNIEDERREKEREKELERQKEKENIFLKAVTGSSTIKRTPVNYNSQKERIQQLQQENNKREKELELEIEKEIERHLKIREEIENNRKK
ncbi:hypothetical protein DICPUDRAFT_157382 [Dictyostelium purpureum]|uniref:Uncharacterized protein n=1 Tax=Dictyostelium purpureum TaxID=5786 RepID=F0ZZ00_DICPU|nr:uncharacterized protein DICPUDRAFT_157382 [Dictyostelium purpureum]EGC30824.1 hypothetical protein DICPUDRAFT_157382 [Dictyostelium purpureum]|eukprot:XP_003292638.1 hypothetical protein DICPUDRAFT_157382 [Dictyostelium purpureum]